MIDESTLEEGYRKCGAVQCSAFFTSDKSLSPAFIEIGNEVYDSIEGKYNTEIRLKPVEGRDAPGTYSIMIDCHLVDYEQLGVWSAELSA